MRVQWLLDRRAAGEEWSRRSASSEYQDDAIRASTRSFAHALEHAGLQYRFVSSEEVGRGELQKANYRLLILPRAIALAPAAAKEIRDFVGQGGMVIADGEPGVFDEHGRRAAKPLLSEIFGGPATRSATNFVFGKGKAVYLSLSTDRRRDTTRRITRILDAAGVKPPFPVVRPDGQPANDVETHIFTNGELTLVALQRDYLPPPASRETVVLILPRPFNVYDIKAKQALGNTDRLEVELGPVEPLLLTLSEKPLAPPSITGPRNAHLGETAEFHIGAGSPAQRHIVHLDVIDPQGSTVAGYSGNLLFADAVTAKLLPLAVNDKTGLWTLRARDMLSGETATTELQVEP
jgi:hypothetical protein